MAACGYRAKIELLLTSAGGGRLLINVERMDLRGFRTWTPDKPGTFEIRGEANGIRFRLEIDGRMRPEEIEIGSRNVHPDADPLVAILR